ncbi:MAG: chromate transporter [Alphaproteobacteria bacterium]
MRTPSSIESASSTERPDLTAIFAAFFQLGCTGFGGGTAGWLHRDIVLRRRWIDDAAFLRMLTVGQALPGSNGVKLTVLIGQHLRGIAGAAVALFGLLLGPFAIVLAAAGIYAGLSGHKTLHDMLDGVAAAVVGLTFATGLRGLTHGTPGPSTLIIAAVTVLCVGVLRWPLVPVVLILGPLSIGLAWPRPRQ